MLMCIFKSFSMIQKMELPYALDALEPVLSRETLEYHSLKHHQTYVDNLNKLIAGTDYELKSLVEIIRSSEGGIFNNAAQIYNHDFYFASLSPRALERGESNRPAGRLQELIVSEWGSYEAFWSALADLSIKTFGSGWGWLVQYRDGSLGLISTSNADTPLTHEGLTPLLTIDVWEHAYYIDYRNLRAKYIDTLQSVIDWEIVGSRLK